MISLEVFYSSLAAVGICAFIAGNGFGVWLALAIVRQMRREWRHEREKAFAGPLPNFEPVTEDSKVMPFSPEAMKQGRIKAFEEQVGKPISDATMQPMKPA